MNKILALMFTGLMVITITSCNNDDDQPDVTSIKGSITLDNEATWAQWVDSGEVQVTLFPAFSLNPPAGWGEVPDDFFGPSVPGGLYAIGAPFNAQNPVVLQYVPGQSTYEYDIEVEPGTYSALAVGFRHDFVVDPTLRTATLGVHWNNENQVSHGIEIKANIGGGNIISLFEFPAPTEISVSAGEQKVINFKADFDFVLAWYR
ncbi:MAG: hypothetical protein OEQ53_07555 [Saprospiraceae bacterium]|nr:hypothetical protein [Saprospiraceae bacterium]